MNSYKTVILETIPITISQTLSKHTSLTKDVNNNNLEECFYKEHWDIKSLLKLLKEYIAKDLEYNKSKYTTRQLSEIYNSCCNWVEDEFEIIKE